MGVRIQELPETTGIKKEDVLIVEDGQGTKKGTVQQLDETLGVSQLKEDLDGILSFRLSKNDIESGTWEHNEKVSWTKRIRSKKRYFVRKGDILVINPNELNVYYAIYESESSANSIESYTAYSNEVIEILQTGFIVFVVSKINTDEVISINDYTCDIHCLKRNYFELLNSRIRDSQKIYTVLKSDKFTQGAWYEGKKWQPQFTYAVASRDKYRIYNQILLKASEGFIFSVLNSSGTILKWNVSEAVLDKGDYYINIRRVKENTSEMANVDDFVSKIKVYNHIQELASYTHDIVVSSNRINKKLDKCLAHLFIQDTYSISSASNAVIPSQSLYDVRVSKRLGFNFIEANVHKTGTDGKYIVVHGDSGKLGKIVSPLQGYTDPDLVNISSTSYDTLRDGYRYRSKYEKYRTPISELEEFLRECKINEVTPIINYVDDTQMGIVQKYFGNNFILSLYGGTRHGFDECYAIDFVDCSQTTMSEVAYKIAVLDNKTCLGVLNATSWSDSDLQLFVYTCHKRGIITNYSGTYESLQTRIKLDRMGFDILTSGYSVNYFESGNYINIDSNITFDSFLHDGNVVEGRLNLVDGNEISPLNISDKVFIGKGQIEIIFNGTILITIGKYNINKQVVSDGSNQCIISSVFIDEIPSFTIRSVGNTIIDNIVYKASKC